MKKEGLWLLILLLTSTNANAFGNGFYTGIALGYSAFNSNITNDRTADTLVTRFLPLTTTRLFVSDVISMNTHGHRSSVVGSGCVGYGISSQDLYFGTEFNLSLANRNIRITENYNSTSISSNGATNITRNFPNILSIRGRSLDYGLDIRPGVLLTQNTLLYGRVGLTFNKFKVLPNISFENTNPLLGPNYSFSVNNSAQKYRLGARFGLGLEQMLYSYLSIKIDYAYTYYQKLRVNLDATTSATVPAGPPRIITGNLNDSILAKMRNHSFMLGLNYFW